MQFKRIKYYSKDDHFMIKNGELNIFSLINQDPKILILILCIVPISNFHWSHFESDLKREISVFQFFFWEIPMNINKS